MSEGIDRKNAQNDKTIINAIYMKPGFPIIKKIVRKLICKCILIFFSSQHVTLETHIVL